jgi:tetratricopeptide (TPR) repeat protein
MRHDWIPFNVGAVIRHGFMTRPGIRGIQRRNTLRYLDEPASPTGNAFDASEDCPGWEPYGWQDRDVEDESELRIRDALLKALGVVPSDGSVPTPELVLAASLHRLAVGRGLAQRDDPNHSAVRTAGLPAAALKLLDESFGADGGPASDDDVRNGLCDALVALSTMPSALRSMNKSRALSGEELLQFAQIYWNLDAEAPRGRLPIPAGQKRPSGRRAFVKVEGADEDYAELELKQRADRTPGYTNGAGAFYDRGARLAALVATRLVDGGAPSVGEGKLRSTKTGRGLEWSIVWRADPLPAPKPTTTKASEQASAGDPTVGTLRQLRQTNVAEGKLGEAVILCTTLIAILRERSEKSPGDHESQLAEEYLRAGLTFGVAGRVEETLEHFASAERISRTLVDLRPDASPHRLRLAIARTMLGVFDLQVGRVDEAEVELVDAVALSQALTDEDAGNEDLLAASLSMLGGFYLQTARPQEALTALSRAVAISQKLVKQNPADATNQLQLASTLGTLGMLYFQVDEEPRAEEVLTRSIAIVEELRRSKFEERMTELLLASDRFALGSVYLSTDQYQEAEESLIAAVSFGRALNDQRPDESTGLLLASASYMLGVLYGTTDRADEAEASLTTAVSVSRDLIARAEGGSTSVAQKTRATTFLGSALCFLGMIFLEQEREQEAEASLVDAVEVFRQRPDDASDQSLLAEALDLLADLYQRQGRAAEAEHILELRRQLDDQSPEAPAVP